MTTRLNGFLFYTAISAGTALFAQQIDYRVLATSRTSSMQREMTDAANNGYVYSSVMGGETSAGGREVVVIMAKTADKPGKHTYRLLCASKTSTIQKELQQAGDEGFEYRGQTVFESQLGGAEVCVITERDGAKPAGRVFYQVLATKRTSTMQKELQAAGADGFQLRGMTVSKTAFGGQEIVSILTKSGS
jgi:hypothetical protein